MTIRTANWIRIGILLTMVLLGYSLGFVLTHDTLPGIYKASLSCSLLASIFSLSTTGSLLVRASYAAAFERHTLPNLVGRDLSATAFNGRNVVTAGIRQWLCRDWDRLDYVTGADAPAWLRWLAKSVLDLEQQPFRILPIRVGETRTWFEHDRTRNRWYHCRQFIPRKVPDWDIRKLVMDNALRDMAMPEDPAFFHTVRAATQSREIVELYRERYEVNAPIDLSNPDWVDENNYRVSVDCAKDVAKVADAAFLKAVDDVVNTPPPDVIYEVGYPGGPYITPILEHEAEVAQQAGITVVRCDTRFGKTALGAAMDGKPLPEEPR